MHKILIIDDLKENVFMLQHRLEKENYVIISANNGEKGIEIAKQEEPDLILLDIMMPGKNGIEVCKELLEMESTKNIPIIMVTAKVGADDIKIGLEAGAFDYIKKPFNQIELLARVRTALKYSEARKIALEAEKKNMFAATVVTANHKIRQPLTLMNLTSSAIKKELEKDEISKEIVLKKLNFLEIAVKEINEVLKQLQNIKDPVFSEYANDIKMIDVDNENGKD
ncbi:MAG: response regulator [Ignavibacteriales bacterium CG12_big_fil_rev_8_21_14_0_65_30_8]|nr:MAG: response regulator [Ignavibacteriales bacterium CG12_big_fil_rev_8_21_14_0_65_30_8]